MDESKRISNESASQPNARTAAESGLVVPEQMSKKILPSGTAKCGDETLACIVNSVFD